MEAVESFIAVKVVSSKDGSEADISGNPQSLRNLHEFMRDFIASDLLEIKASTVVANAAPYANCLTSLFIRKGQGATKVSVIDDRLDITGDCRRLETFARWFEFPDDTPPGYHLHHDGLCGDEWVDPESLSLVISVGKIE